MLTSRGDRRGIRWAVLRRFGPLGLGLAAGVGAFAAVAASWAAVAETGRLQLALALVASLVTGVLTFLQSRGQLVRASAADARHSDQDLSEPPAPRSTLRQLPPDIEDFTGREGNLAEVRSVLEREQGRGATAVVISAISGQGGVGKTALALRVAHQLDARYPDGQLYVDLRGVGAAPREPAEVLAGFLRALGVEDAAIPGNLEERASLFRARLSGRRVLLVLDNAANEFQVRHLLPGSPTCAVLITSRTRLPELAGSYRVDLDVMEPAQAVELLSKIAGPDRIATDPEAAEAIVRLCGYLPLAIRIAGAKLATRPQWTPAKLAARLADEHRRLDVLSLDGLDVRATFFLSYDGLEEQERRMFRLLGSLPAPNFAAWSAAALYGTGLEKAEDLLDRLADARLLEIAERQPTDDVRYRFHDLVRDFARGCLENDEALEARRAALERLLDTSIGLAQQSDAMLRTRYPEAASRFGMTNQSARPSEQDELVTAVWNSVQATSLRWLTAEREVLISSVELAYENSRWQQTCELAGSLTAFLDYRSYWKDLEETHQRARGASEELGDPRWMAYTTRAVGVVYYLQGRSDEALDFFDECLPIFRELGDRFSEAGTLSNIAAVHRPGGRLEKARTFWSQALTIFQELGARREAAHVLANLGDVYRLQGHQERALECFAACLPVFRELGEDWWEANVGVWLGHVRRARHEWDQAFLLLNQSRSVFRELGDRRKVGFALLHIGEVFLDLDRWTEAHASFEECVQIFRELGDRWWEARTRLSQGRAFQGQGRWKEAITCYELCLPVFRSIGNRLREAETLGGMGAVWQALKEFPKARDAYQEALTIYESELAPNSNEAMRLRRGLDLVDALIVSRRRPGGPGRIWAWMKSVAGR